MKIIVIGATGTIGSEVAKALSLKKHEVLRGSRNGDVKVNLDDPASIRAMFEKIRDVDAVISCAGNAVFKPFADLTDTDYELGLRSKLMGQVSLARIGKDHVREGGSITLTTGVLATQPCRGALRSRSSTLALKASCALLRSKCRECFELTLSARHG